MEHEKIGQVTDEVKEIFAIVLESSDIKVNKDGLRSHMIKRHHNDVIHHIEDLEPHTKESRFRRHQSTRERRQF